MTAPDPRWDEAAEQLIMRTINSTADTRDDEQVLAWFVRPALAALADAGRLLTPQMAEVLERARAVADAVRHTSALTGSPPHPMSWRAEILAAVDAWEASREH